MSALFKIGFFLLLLFNLIFASWYVSHGDISFTADIGRDFHLLREIDEKKIILIGPRTSNNLYHGPLWLYINYPAYLIGQGNPIAVGWNWVLLWAAFTALCFFVGKQLCNTKVAMLFSGWASLYLAFSIHEMNNPHGALILMPAFIYFFVRYVQYRKVSFLIGLLLTLGAITHFEIGLGIPFFLLVVPPVVYVAWKHKKKRHLFAFGLIFLIFANFILFEVRHNFVILTNIMTFVAPTVDGKSFNYLTLVQERIMMLFTQIQFLREHMGIANLLLFLALLVGIAIQIKENKYRVFYLSVLYFYFGFFLLSFINKGPILIWYLYPMFPLFFLVASSFYTSRFKSLFLVIYCVLLFFNIRTAIAEIHRANAYIGNSVYSWKFLHEMSQKVFQGKENSFGYFVYAPDVLAYEPKYAMLYVSDSSDKEAASFVKQPVTYLILQPPPPKDPEMKPDWWIMNQVTIHATPSAVITFSNGYEIRKYHLTEEETHVDFDPAIDPGIHFR